MDRLQTMSVFVGVAEEGGFAPAARRLNMSPSGVDCFTNLYVVGDNYQHGEVAEQEQQRALHTTEQSNLGLKASAAAPPVASAADNIADGGALERLGSTWAWRSSDSQHLTGSGLSSLADAALESDHTAAALEAAAPDARLQDVARQFRPAETPADLATDAGAHNLLRISSQGGAPLVPVVEEGIAAADTAA